MHATFTRTKLGKTNVQHDKRMMHTHTCPATRRALTRDALHTSTPFLLASLMCLFAGITGCEGDLSNNTLNASDAGQTTPSGDMTRADMPGGSQGGDMRADMPTIPASDCGVTALYQKLEPTCATCHRSGSTPYFSSPDAFYNLIVSNPDWVVPGAPENSELLALLRGEARGAYAQMPLGAESFEDLEARGETQVTIAEVANFVTEIEGCQRGTQPGNEHTPVERKRARQIVNTLYQHLGITKKDVLPFTKGRNYNDSLYPIYNPDDTKPVTNDPHISPSRQGPGIRWYAIGGGSRFYVTRSSSTYSPTFGQAIIQVSQAWCGFAAKKENNQALFKHVEQTALGEATDAQVIENIRYLMLRFWGHVAGDEEINAMKAQVYDIYIPDEGPNNGTAHTAWIAVCATLIRDPMWLSY